DEVAHLARRLRFEEPLDERRDIRIGERIESEADGVAPAAAPGPPALEQLRSSETQQDERSRKRRLGELFDQIDEAVRRVLQILEHDEERALRRDPLDEAAPRADDLLAVLIRRGLLR